MFERFTEKAIKVIMLAQEESRRMGHNFVGTEQILLGLCGEGTGIAARVLRAHNVKLKDLRATVFQIIGKGSGNVAVEIPFTPRAKKLLEAAWNAARDLGHNYIGTEHVLLGLLAVDGGPARQALSNLNVDLEKMRIDVLDFCKLVSPQKQRALPVESKSKPGSAEKESTLKSTANARPSAEPKPSSQLIYSEAANKSLELAQKEALRVSCNVLELEHLLLGIFGHGITTAHKMLAAKSINLQKLRSATASTSDQSPTKGQSDDFEFSSKVIMVLRMAAVSARSFGSLVVTTEHILLALLSYEESKAVKGLQTLGVNIELFMDELRKAIKAAVIEEEKRAEAAIELARAVESKGKQTDTGDLPQPSLKLTEMVEHAISIAKEEAHRLGHVEVDTDHVLLGLMAEADGLASLALHVWDVKTKELRQESENMPGRERSDSPCESRCGSKVNELILAARQLARESKQTCVGTDHVLLALLADEDSAGLKVLRNLSIDTERLKKMLQNANTPPQAGATYSALVPLSKQRGFERFSEEAIKALMFSKEEASRLGHSQIDSQFLLLGICDERLNKGAERLRKVGISLDDLRFEVERLTGHGEGNCGSEMVFGESLLKAMQYTFDKVVSAGLEVIRPEHLFIGVVFDESGPVCDVLKQFNISVERIIVNSAIGKRKTELDAVEASRVDGVRQLLGLRESEMDELFTMTAIDALLRAQSETLALLHSSFEPDHILLGVTSDKNSAAAMALKLSGIEPHQLRSGAQHLDAKSSSKPQTLRVSRKTKQVLESAFDIAEQRKSAAIDCDHLLLGILETNACAELFRWGRLDYKRFKTTVMELLGLSRSKLVLVTESLEPFELSQVSPPGKVPELTDGEIDAPVKVEPSAENLLEKHFKASFSETIKLAASDSRRLGRNEVGTEHLLVGICAEGTSAAAKAMSAVGVTDALLRITNEKLFGKGTDQPCGELPFSKNATLAIEKAFKEAQTFGSDIVGADELLLGILDLQKIIDYGSLIREDCSAVKILRTLGVDISLLRNLLLENLRAAIDEDKHPVFTQSERLAEIANFSPDVLNRFANFSADSLKVVMVAQEAARTLGYSVVGSEQILIGLMFVDEGKTAAILKFIGMTPEILISLVDRFIGKEPTAVVSTLPYTVKAQQLFERAKEAAALVHGPVTTEHLLLSLLDDQQSLACIILQWVGADFAKLKEAVAEPNFDYQAAICKVPYQVHEVDYEHAEDYWHVLEERFTANLRTVIAGAKADSCRRNKGVVDASLLLFALVNLPTNSCAHYLEAINLDRFAVRDKLDKLIPSTNQDKMSNFMEFDTLAKQALLRAFQLSRFEGGGWVQTKHLLLALLEPQGKQHLSLLEAIGLSSNQLTAN